MRNNNVVLEVEFGPKLSVFSIQEMLTQLISEVFSLLS